MLRLGRSYSITQPELSKQLRDNKLNALESGNPEVIVTANIGCQTHLDGANRTPVRHWIEIVDEALASGSAMVPGRIARTPENNKNRSRPCNPSSD